MQSSNALSRGRAVLPSKRSEGFSLLEVAVALAVGTTVVVVLGNVLVGTTNSLDYVVKDIVSQQDIQKTIGKIRDEIRDSSASYITVQTGAVNDTLTLQASYNNGTGLVYGAEDDNGYFQVGWSVRYTAVGTDLVRQVLGTSGSVVSSGIVAQEIDTVSGGQKGFQVVKNGDLYTIRITVNKQFSDSKTYTKSMQSTVLVQN